METTARFLQPPEQSFFLFGPRGTGKTTWLRHELPEARFFDLLRAETYRELAARPERLAEAALALPPGATVVLDEVQRLPELLPVVHDLIERKLGYRFVLTGSSARKLRRQETDLLAGRAVVRTLHPFMAAELPRFDLQEALVDGLLPLVVAATDSRDVLAAYAGMYLEEEVRAEAMVRNIGSFSRFLEAVSFSQASVLNVAAVAREAQVQRKTVAGYLELLEDLLLSFRLPVFTKRARRRPTAHPKFFFFDAGVFRSLRPRGPLDRPEEIDGGALEGLVAQHLRAWCAYTSAQAELFYWHTRGGSEVDFVVYGEAGFWAIEVKNARRVDRADLRGLRAFREDYPECASLLLYRGEEALRIDGVMCRPVAEFLESLHPSKPIAG
jgi:predicted AAA+ superfamily ATPase